MPEIGKEHLEWVRRMRDQAGEEVIKAKDNLEAARKQFEESSQRFQTWESAFADAKRIAGVGNSEEYSPPETSKIKGPIPQFRPNSIPSIAFNYLKRAGSGTTARIYQAVRESGKSVTESSVDSSLNRYQPKIFNRKAKGEWVLTEDLL